MATTFTVTSNLDAVLRQLGIALTREINAAAARALNRTATSERAKLSTDIASDMGLKVGTVKDGITIEKATANNLAVRIIAKGARIPLIQFGARGPEPSRGRGTGVTAKNPGGAGRYPHAFITTVGGQHRGVFERDGRSRSRRGLPAGSPGLPIHELFGPSIVKVFEKMVPIGEARRTDVLVKNLQHEIEFALSRVA